MLLISYVPDLQIKLYHRNGCIGKKTAYMGLGPICDFKHLLGVLKCVPVDKGAGMTAYIGYSCHPEGCNFWVFLFQKHHVFLLSLNLIPQYPPKVSSVELGQEL